MRPEELTALLENVRRGETSVEAAVDRLRHVPVQDLGFAQIDTHRELRQGMPEAIYAESKPPEQVVEIAARMLETTTGAVVATRVPDAAAQKLVATFPDAVHHAVPRLTVLRPAPRTEPLGTATVACAGTSDLPVAEEAAVTAEAMGIEVDRITDVGVAGVHRVLAVQDRLAHTDVVIVVAGMEGALASLVGGITPAPVIAVPTSIGYGAAFDGLAALLGMLTSCAAGIAVMNIDNGFGAASFATRLLLSRS